MPMATTAPWGRPAPGSGVDRLVGNVFGGSSVKTSDGMTEKGVVVDGLVIQATLRVLRTEINKHAVLDVHGETPLTVRDILLIRNDRITRSTGANLGHKHRILAIVVGS